MKLITGNTYPVKDQIRALGGTWSKLQRGWLVPDDKAEEAIALVKYAPPAARAPSRPTYRTNRYAVTSSRSYGRCSCEDYPCCGCG